jgi:hypothetical protein
MAILAAYAVALAFAAALAVPILSFLFLIFSFGLSHVILTGIGLVALIGPLLLLINAVLVWLGRTRADSLWPTTHAWACSLIVHAGASHGVSKWGDVGNIMGGKNSTYLEAFLFPLTFVTQLLFNKTAIS